MTVIRPILILTAQGAVVSARGLVMYGRRRGRVDRHFAFVDAGDSTRRLDPERYHVLETCWVSASNVISVRQRGYKRQLPSSTPMGFRG